MFKLAAILFFIFAIHLTKGELSYYPGYGHNSSLHIDAYINLIRQQHEMDINEFDKEISFFKQSYATSLEIINRKMDLLMMTLVQSNENFNLLTVISESTRKCVHNFRHLLPTIVGTKAKIFECMKEPNEQLPSLMVNVINTRNYLQNYYKNTFETNIANCERIYGMFPQNYTICVKQVVADTNTYTITHQKLFSQQMSSLKCSADTILRQTLECSFEIEYSTLKAIGEVTVLIKRCLGGGHNCVPCVGYSCSEIFYMDQSEMNYDSKIIKNPFYGLNNNKKECLHAKIR